MSNAPNTPGSPPSLKMQETYIEKEQEEVMKMVEEQGERIMSTMNLDCKRAKEEAAMPNNPGLPEMRDICTKVEREEAMMKKWDSLLQREKAKAEKAELEMLWYYDWIKELVTISNNSKEAIYSC
jgi:hypothetical protein